MKIELVFPKPQLHFYNTEKRQKLQFHPHKDNHVLMYTCGPTVYSYAHIGNFRTYVFEDILRRTLKFFGLQVTQAMNLTDIDDKTLRGALQNKCTLDEFTQPFKRAFFVDIGELGIERAEYYPEATHYVGYMIDFINNLLDKGVAYKSQDKSIYFSILKSKNYGRLSHLKLDELQINASARSINDEYEKESVGDFVLWKAYDEARDGSVFWESPFGRGRPGWHLECSTMAIEILGATIDLHVGAVDNIFPHHENEIAQSEAFSNKLFVHFWMHSEHLLVDGKKMSKSLGNFYTLRDLLNKGYGAKEVRYMLMHIHYRTQLNFTFEGMKGARNALKRINDFIIRMNEKADQHQTPSYFAHSFLQKAIYKFSESLADDLNISEALAAIFDLMNQINTLDDAKQINEGDAREVLFVFREFDRILNVMDFEVAESIPEELQELLRAREEARKAKEWARSDQLREQLLAQGYLIEDTPSGPRLKKA